MIRDQDVRSVIARDWEGIRRLCTRSQEPVFVLDKIVDQPRSDESYNLPFLLVYGVLDEVLTELRDQGQFSCPSRQLGHKMAASRNHLPWDNYDLVDQGRNARNRLAHDTVLLSKCDCLKYVDAVESELHMWGVM